MLADNGCQELNAPPPQNAPPPPQNAPRDGRTRSSAYLARMADLVLRCVVGLVAFAGVCATLVFVAERATKRLAPSVAPTPAARPDRGVVVSYRVVTPVHEEMLADQLEVAGGGSVHIGPEAVSCEVFEFEALFAVHAVARTWGLVEVGAAPEPHPSDLERDWDRVVSAHNSGTPLRVTLIAPMRIQIQGELHDAWGVRFGALLALLHGMPTSASPRAEVDARVLKYDRAGGVLEFLSREANT